MAWGCNRSGGWWDSVWTLISSPPRSSWRLPPTGEPNTPARIMAGCARLTISTNSPGITAIFSSIIDCYVTALVPRVVCPDHGIKQVKMP
ncbi:hypothetical protein DFAR_4040031 [Desulfarculales bacterium]